MSNLVLKWKHWYWYYALLSNVSAALFLVLEIIFVKKNILTLSDLFSFIFFCISSSVVMFLFLIYLYKSTKELRACKVLIKKDRAKYLQWGCLSSFLMFNFYIMLWFVAYKITSLIPIYIALPFVIICGIFSSVMLTIYEFCLSFDIHYHKHKNEIVSDFLKNMHLNKIKENDEEIDKNVEN